MNVQDVLSAVLTLVVAMIGTCLGYVMFKADGGLIAVTMSGLLLVVCAAVIYYRDWDEVWYPLFLQIKHNIQKLFDL